MTRRNAMGGTIPPLGKPRRLAGKSTKASRAEADALIAAAAAYMQSSEYARMGGGMLGSESGEREVMTSLEIQSRNADQLNELNAGYEG